MGISDDIEKIILLDKKNILREIEHLKKRLSVKEQMDKVVAYLDDIDSVYTRNLDFEKKHEDIKKQLELNKEKKLELLCKIKGKSKYIKSFGTIGLIDKATLLDISRLLSLLKLIKKISDVSHQASQYYRTDELSNVLDSKGAK